MLQGKPILYELVVFFCGYVCACRYDTHTCAHAHANTQVMCEFVNERILTEEPVGRVQAFQLKVIRRLLSKSRKEFFEYIRHPVPVVKFSMVSKYSRAANQSHFSAQYEETIEVIG